jgi:hypothetical protein
MTVRSWVTFRSDLADDGVETEDGHNFTEWPGRVHVLMVAELLQTLGWQVTGTIDVQERGWELDARLDRKAIWMQVTPLDEVIVIIKDGNPEWIRYLAGKGPGPVFTGMLTALDTALHNDGRFHDIRWFTQKEHNCGAPGAPAPISDIKQMAGYVPPPPPPPPPPRPWREWDHPWRDR